MLLAFTAAANARGVSPYLPLNLEPEIEAQIERVLILAGKPVMRRPIAAATVLDALPEGLQGGPGAVRTRARATSAVTPTRAAVTHVQCRGSPRPTARTRRSPNRYGQRDDSAWDASLSGYLQPSDYLLSTSAPSPTTAGRTGPARC